MVSRYASLSRGQLAVLVPELLLCGQLIDRSGMAWCIQAFGREGMAQVAIEEWMAASPIYTKRMQRALGFEGSDVVTIFKGLQLDIGAPPQFMDFRYQVVDSRHGSFSLAHCGALMDVEPMGENYVRSMCHDIEDPTFDATALATHPRAQIRPVHRPPRVPSDRHPHCSWTVTIDDSFPEVGFSEGFHELARSVAATVELDPIDASGEGLADYSGPLLADVDFGAFSHSALVRIADEVTLQMQLLALGFIRALRRRLPVDEVTPIVTKQLTGIAGIAAERLHRALALPASEDGVAQLLALHPMLNPAAYVSLRDGVKVVPSPAHEDGGWLAYCGPHSPAPLQAVARAVDPRLDVEVSGSHREWTARVVRREDPAKEFDEVAVTRFSTGSSFRFEGRRSLPLTVLG